MGELEISEARAAWLSFPPTWCIGGRAESEGLLTGQLELDCADYR